MLASCLPSLIVYPNVIQNEESHLQRLFPEEFREYCAKVPRFLPSIRRVERCFSFRQYVANREYNTAIGFVVSVVIFIVKSRLI